MRDTISQLMAGVTPELSRYFLKRIFNSIGDRLSSQSLESAGLAINGIGSPLAKAGNTFHAIANGKLRKVVANTVMPALVGTVAQNQFNVFIFTIDQLGVVTSAMGTEGANLESVGFPEIPEQSSMIGFLIITNTAAAFVGGTTALDAAGVTVNFINWVGAGDAKVLLGHPK